MKYTANNKPLVCMMTQSTCYKGTSKMTPKGVLWHSTGANNPTLKRYVQPDDNALDRDELLALIGKNQYNNDWNHIERQAGLNAWIGKLADGTVVSIQTMPWDFRPWGCGSGPKGSCNNGWMQFEICEDDLTDKAYFDKVYKEACELTAYYCKMYNLNPLGMVMYNGVEVPVILDHQTSYRLGLGGNHGDVQHWFKKFGKTLEDVRKDVADLMGIKDEPREDGKIDGVYVKGEKVQLAPSFVSTEFDCHGKDCCSETLVDQKLVEYLQKIHDHFKKATYVSSGYRCPVHNKNVDGATGSHHTKGQAADIYINGVEPREIAKYAESIGIKGIGLYETDKDGHFVHVDVRPTKSFWYGQAQEYRSTFMEEPKPVKPDTSKVDTSPVDAKVMWDFFKSKGLNDYGVAGLMGNLQAESGLVPTNLQNSYEKKLGLTDAEYTAAVDAGSYDNFVKDSAGYGLAQWTYWSLKQEMLNYHKKAGKSIGDGKTQMEFLCHQLSTSYKSVWSTLQNAKSVREASDAVLLKFERPADQSESVQVKREKYGQSYYDKYHIEPTKPALPAPSKSKFKEGDIVILTEDAVYYNGKSIPTWVKNKAWVVKYTPTGDRVVINKSEDGKHSINSPVHEKYLRLKEEEKAVEFVPYLVRITANKLNYRQGPGLNYPVRGTVKKNQVYTIIGESGDWGKLKSGAGWIHLGYTEKL